MTSYDDKTSNDSYRFQGTGLTLIKIGVKLYMQKHIFNSGFISESHFPVNFVVTKYIASEYKSVTWYKIFRAFFIVKREIL